MRPGRNRGEAGRYVAGELRGLSQHVWGSAYDFSFRDGDGARVHQLVEQFQIVMVDFEREMQPVLEALLGVIRTMEDYANAVAVLAEFPEGEPGIDAYSGPVTVDIDECWREDCDAEVSRDDDVGLCESCKAELKEA
jgi:hypothetical protein